MYEMAEPDIVEEFEGIEDAKAKKKQATGQRKRDRAEGKVIPRQPKATKTDAKTEGGYPTTPTKKKYSTTSKKKDGQSQAGAIAKAVKVTKKKPVAEGDKGPGKHKFVMPRSDNDDSEEGDEIIPTSQTLFTATVTAGPKQTAKRTMFDASLDDAIGSSLSKAPYRPKSFDAANENPFLDSIPVSSAKKNQG